MAKLDIWSLWACAACVEKELDEGTCCLFVNFILPARRRPGVRARCSEIRYRPCMQACMAQKKKIMMVGFRCTAFAEAATEKVIRANESIMIQCCTVYELVRGEEKRGTKTDLCPG
jgi:hypothetical protein